MDLHFNKIESHSPKDVCAKFVLNRPGGSGEEDFLILSMHFRYFVIISPWKREGRALHLNKLESPSPKDALCQVWLKMAQWFSGRRFLNLVNLFSIFRNYLPLEKGPFIKKANKLVIPSFNDDLC